MDEKKNKSEYVKYLQYSSIGIEMGAAVALGAFIGYKLDEWLGTEPWMLLFWLLCGIAAGFRSLYRMTKKIMGKNTLEKDDKD